MDYQFVCDLDEKEYLSFLSKMSMTSFMQDAAWGKVKSNWKSLLCGIRKDDQLVTAFQILIKPLPLKKCLFYIPRGPVCDFLDDKLLRFLAKELKCLAKKYHAYVVKIDPNFCIQETSILEVEKNEAKIVPRSYSLDWKSKHQNLLAAGFRHKGFKKKLSDYLQPRYNMAIPLVDSSFDFLTENEIRSQFKKRIKDYTGNYHVKRGVYFEHTNDVSKLDEFMEVISETEKRQNINLRSRDYFEKIMNAYQEKAYLFFGKVNLLTYRSFLEETSKNEDEILEIQNLIDQGKETLTLSCSLVILPPNNEGIRTSEYLYAGNHLLLTKLQVSYGIVYDICKFSQGEGCHFLNLGGIMGTMDDHLTTFKSRFNAIVWEFIGEYDLVVNKWFYFPIEKCLPVLKKIYRKIRK